jgi:hypothetical protein
MYEKAILAPSGDRAGKRAPTSLCPAKHGLSNIPNKPNRLKNKTTDLLMTLSSVFHAEIYSS